MARRDRWCGEAEVVPGGVRRPDLDGLPPFAAFDVEGIRSCTVNVCTRDVATVTDGFLEGDAVQFPPGEGLHADVE